MLQHQRHELDVEAWLFFLTINLKREYKYKIINSQGVTNYEKQKSIV